MLTRRLALSLGTFGMYLINQLLNTNDVSSCTV